MEEHDFVASNPTITRGDDGNWYNDKGKRVCASPLRNKPGKLCTCPVIFVHNGRCRLHGGMSPKGIAHPNYRDRGTSKYLPHLPQRLRHSYKTALAASDLSVYPEIALLEVRLTDLLRQVDAGESDTLWQDLQTVAQEALDACEANDWTVASEKITLLTDLVQRSAEDHRVWEQILKLSMDKAKLSATQHRMDVDAKQMIPVDKVLLVLAAVAAEVREQVVRNVSDPRIQRTILIGVSNVVARHLGRDDSSEGGAPAGGLMEAAERRRLAAEAEEAQKLLEQQPDPPEDETKTVH